MKNLSVFLGIVLMLVACGKAGTTPNKVAVQAPGVKVVTPAPDVANKNMKQEVKIPSKNSQPKVKIPNGNPPSIHGV